MISIIIIIALFIIFLFKYIRLKNQICIDNLDNRINELREKYKRMLKDNRLSIDLCTKKSKIGSNREKDIKSIGNNCEPWISRECIYVLDNILPFKGNGLEWSSGSSTIWLSYRLKYLVSVEHKIDWYEQMKAKLRYLNSNNTIKLICINRDNLNYCKSDYNYITKAYGYSVCFKTYITTNKIPNIMYDFISVDGRVRVGCFLRAIKMIKKENGIIILDNAERRRYKIIYTKIPSTWSKYDFWYKNGLVTMFITHK